MANYKKLIPFIQHWEGGFVDDKHDLGGATNRGVTLQTYQLYCSRKGIAVPDVEQLKALTETEWVDIFRTLYWDRWRADKILDQSVANIAVDWLWCSGSHSIWRTQRLLGVAVDGIVGNDTLSAINSHDPRWMFGAIKADRIEFIEGICKKRPENERYHRGWMNRINALVYD